MVGGWFLGTSLFPVWLPVGQVVRCILAVVPMSIALLLVPLPQNWLGLFAAVGMGGALYLVSAALLDVGGVWSMGRDALRKPLRTKVAALTD